MDWAELTARSAAYCISESAFRHLADKVRCILGPLPFRSVIMPQSCLTPTVQNLAAVINEERDFDRLPILGNALEKAGCDNQDVLRHCRQVGEHVRGCWVVDLILGKE